MSSMGEELLSKEQRVAKSKNILKWAALFLGELRDGLTMVRNNKICYIFL